MNDCIIGIGSNIEADKNIPEMLELLSADVEVVQEKDRPGRDCSSPGRGCLCFGVTISISSFENRGSRKFSRLKDQLHNFRLGRRHPGVGNYP